jgi:hypothetical protein
MTINPPRKLLIAFTISCGLLVVGTTSVRAATFSLSPSSGSTVGGTFDVTLNLIDLGGKAVSGIDAYLNYEPSKLEAQSINVSGGIFADYPLRTIDPTNGKVVIGAGNGSAAAPNTPVTAPGRIATITFKTLATSGSTTLNFDYTSGSTIDSNITEARTGTDILTTPPTVTYSIQPTGPFIFHLVPIWNKITWLTQLPTTFTSYSALDHIENGCPRPQDPPRAVAQRKNGWWESFVRGYGGIVFPLVAAHDYYIKVASVCDWQPGS